MATGAEDLPITAYGCDTHQPSVMACRSHGLNVSVGEIQDVFAEERFDVICAFHCLEHVSDPVSFVISARKKLSQGGKIFLSVPYSPTLWDVLYNDCLNLPPHHLTRWNKTSLEALAKRGGLKLHLLTPTNRLGIVRNVCYTLIESHSDLRDLTRLQLVWRILKDRELRAQAWKLVVFFLKRPKLDGNIAGNVVLAICTVT